MADPGKVVAVGTNHHPPLSRKLARGYQIKNAFCGRAAGNNSLILAHAR